MSDPVTVTVTDALSARVEVRGHVLTVGEPEEKGGADDGPTPMETFLGGLSACVAITLRMYANLKGLPVRKITVHADQERKARADLPADEIPEWDDREEIPFVDLKIEVEGDLTEAQIERLGYIATRCPVHRVVGEHPIVHEHLVHV